MLHIFNCVTLMMLLACFQLNHDRDYPNRESAEHSAARKSIKKDGMGESFQSAVVITTGVWKVDIRQDGSGYVWFGSSGVPVAVFGARTFKVNKIVPKLRAKLLKERSTNKDCLSAWFPTTDKSGEVLWEKSPGPISKIFEQIQIAYKDGKALSSTKDFLTLWQKHPPVVAKRDSTTDESKNDIPQNNEENVVE